MLDIYSNLLRKPYQQVGCMKSYYIRSHYNDLATKMNQHFNYLDSQPSGPARPPSQHSVVPTCAAHFLSMTARVPSQSPAVENPDFYSVICLLQIASAIIFNVTEHLNLTIFPMKIYTREHAS